MDTDEGIGGRHRKRRHEMYSEHSGIHCSASFIAFSKRDVKLLFDTKCVPFVNSTILSPVGDDERS